MAKEVLIIRNEALRKTALFTIGALDLEKPWKVTIERESKRRTLSQNRLMWQWVDGVVAHIYEHTGTDKNDVHDFLKKKFLHSRHIVIGASGEDCDPSTKNLNIAEMAKYMEQIYAWATTELGLFLPVPEDLGRERAA